MAKNTIGLQSGTRGAVMKSYFPSIIPTPDEPRVLGNSATAGQGVGIVALQDAGVEQGNRTSATGVNTLSGAPAVGDTVSMTIQGVTVSVVVGAGPPPLATIATNLAAAINNNPDLYGLVRASANGAVITLTHNGGAAGKFVPVTVNTTTTGSLVQTLSGLTGGKLTGGTGPVKALRNFAWTVQLPTVGFPHTHYFTENHYYLLSDFVVQQLVTGKQPIA
jgi:hypothetical protein